MNLVKLTKCKLLGFGFLLCFFLVLVVVFFLNFSILKKIIVDHEIVALLNLFGFE